MSEAVVLLAQFVLGLAGGAVFFGGLWLTVCYVTTRRASAITVMASLLARLTALFGVLYLSTLAGRWYGVLITLSGILLVKVVISKVLAAQSSGGERGLSVGARATGQHTEGAGR